MKKIRLTVLFMAVGLAFTSISFLSCKPQADDNTNKVPEKTQEEIEAEQKAKAMTDAFNAKKAVYGEKEYIDYEEYQDEQNYTKIRLLNTKKLIFKDDTITVIDLSDNSRKEYPLIALKEYFSSWFYYSNSDSDRISEFFFSKILSSDEFDDKLCINYEPNTTSSEEYWFVEYNGTSSGTGNDDNAPVDLSKLSGTWYINKGTNQQQNVTVNTDSRTISVTANVGSAPARTATFTVDGNKIKISFEQSAGGTSDTVDATYSVTATDSSVILNGESGDVSIINITLFQAGTDSSFTLTK